MQNNSLSISAKLQPIGFAIAMTASRPARRIVKFIVVIALMVEFYGGEERNI